jgi:hypothetical protein
MLRARPMPIRDRRCEPHSSLRVDRETSGERWSLANRTPSLGILSRTTRRVSGEEGRRAARKQTDLTTCQLNIATKKEGGKAFC